MPLTCVKDEDVIHNPLLAVALPTAKHHEVLAELRAGLAIASAGRLALNLCPKKEQSEWCSETYLDLSPGELDHICALDWLLAFFSLDRRLSRNKALHF